MTSRPFDQILSIRDLNQTATRLGSYFFTPGAMRFFNSRIGTKVYTVTGSTGYFVTSEQMDETSPRLWSVRRYAVVEYTREDGRVCDRLDIDVIGEYQGYDSAPSANEAAREAAEAEREAQG